MTVWTQDEIETLRSRYPNEPTQRIADDLGKSVRSIYNKVHALGIKKSQAYLDSPAAFRFRREQTEAQKAKRFQPGMVPHNKGQSFHAGGRSKETQFKKGEMRGAAQQKYVPIGSTRINYGNLERKVTDDPSIVPTQRWKPVHRMLWEAEHGDVPANHIVVFKEGQHTTDESEITLDRIECISRAENMRRNSYHTRYPKDVALAIQLRGVLNRKINQWSNQ